MALSTVTDPCEASLKIRRSTFIGLVQSVDSVAAAKKAINLRSSEHGRATHNCWAYIIGYEGETSHSSDAGEPSGSAGRPILNALKSSSLTNVVAVVTRYYGGVKLGVRGLIEAYEEATNAALAVAKLVPVVATVTFEVSLPYELSSTFLHQMTNFSAQCKQEYGASVKCLVEVPLDQEEPCEQYLTTLAATSKTTFTEAGKKLNMAPIVGVTMGDPCGIGPEIVVKSLCNEKLQGNGCRFIVFGSSAVIEEIVDKLGIEAKVFKTQEVEEATEDNKTIVVYECSSFGRVGDRFGKELKEAGQAALDAINMSAEMVCQDQIQAVATAPVSKTSLKLAGCKVPGHAEIFAGHAKAGVVATMLMHGEFRVVHLSTHVSLRQACDLVKHDRIVTMTKLAHRALQAMGIDQPKIALAGLNPHGGDGGLFGTEEGEEIAPAAKTLQGLGIEAHGPIPADIVFPQALGGMWDAVLAMYHDQGHIPIKTASFSYNREQKRWDSTGGATLTLGLPFARTSVDHGTAFDVAGKGMAEPSAMVSAIELAARMA